MQWEALPSNDDDAWQCGGWRIAAPPRWCCRPARDSYRQSLNPGGVVADLMVAARRQMRMLEPVEHAPAGERRAALTPGEKLPGKDRQYRVIAQLIVVDPVLIAERKTEHPLRYRRRDAVLDPGPGQGRRQKHAANRSTRPIAR
jgi:hypothetical protein